MSIRSAVAWTFSEQMLRYVVRLGASVVIARLLTPGEMGVFALAVSASVLLESLRLFGVGSYLIREPDLDDGRIRSALGLMMALSWPLGALLWLGRDAVAAVYAEPGIGDVLAILAVEYFVAPFAIVPTALLSRDMRFRTLHHIGLASATTSAAVSVGLAWLGMSYLALAWGNLALTAGGVLFAALFNPRGIYLLPSSRHWREVGHFGGLLSLTSIVSTVNSEGTKLILGGVLSPAQVGLYERAVQLPDLFRRSVFAPLGRVIVPAWSSDLREKRSIDQSALTLVAVSTAVVWPVFLALGLIAEPFIVLVFGANWRVAGQVMPVLLLAQSLFVALPQPEQVLIPHGRVRTLLGVRTAAAAFSLATAVYGAWHGLEGFVVARLGAALFLTCLVYFSVRAPLGFAWRRYAGVYLRSAVVATIAAAPAAIQARLSPDRIELVGVAVLAVSCGAAWLVAVIVVHPPMRAELARLRRAVVRR
ncbi:MAG: oligosaccharide flippase family protein [Gammaproteobacteria bacterium]